MRNSYFLDKALETKAANTEALLKESIDGMTIEDKLTEQTGVIGEKLEIGGYEVLEAAFVATYIHAGNKLAALRTVRDGIVGRNQDKDSRPFLMNVLRSYNMVQLLWCLFNKDKESCRTSLIRCVAVAP